MKTEFLWHPLYKYVFEIKGCYFNILNDVYSYKENNISEEEYLERLNSTDFKAMLEFLTNVFNGKYISNHKDCTNIPSMLKIFTFMTINCNKNLVLFKYSTLFGEDNDGNIVFNGPEEFWSSYDGLFRECRSVVFDIESEEIVLSPQKKFFNYKEINEYSEENVKIRFDNAKKIEITNKLDGSNCNGRYYHGEYILSGSQSLNIENSWRLANEYALLNDNYKKLLRDYSDYTVMFEYISPDNPIIVRYTKEQEGLYLFGMRNVFTGEEKSYEEVLEIGRNYGVKTTEIYDDSFEDILSKLDDYTCDEKEGWVINLIDKDNHNFKMKLKINDYVEMHRSITNLISSNSVIKAIADNKLDDFIAKIPTAYREKTMETITQVMTYLFGIDNEVNKVLSAAKNELKENYSDKKTFALWLKNNVSKKIFGYCMNRYIGKENYYLMKQGNGYKKLNELKF